MSKNHGTFFPVQNTLSQKMFRDFMDVLNDAKMTTKKKRNIFRTEHNLSVLPKKRQYYNTEYYYIFSDNKFCKS